MPKNKKQIIEEDYDEEILEEEEEKVYDNYIFNAVTERWELVTDEEEFFNEVARLAKACRGIDPMKTDPKIQHKFNDFLSDFVEINFGLFIETVVLGMSNFIQSTMVSEVDINDKEQNKFLVDTIVKRYIKGDPRIKVKHKLTNGRQAILYSYGVNLIVMELLKGYNPGKANSKAKFTTYLTGSGSKGGKGQLGGFLKSRIIREYNEDNKGNKTYYSIDNIRKINQAVEQLKKTGKDHTSLPLLSELTGLSEKVIRQELESLEYDDDIMSRNRYVKDDEGHDVDIINDDSHETRNASSDEILPTHEEYSKEEDHRFINECLQKLSKEQQMSFCLSFLYHPSFLLGFDKEKVKETVKELGDYELGLIIGIKQEEVDDMKKEWRESMLEKGLSEEAAKEQVDEMTHRYMLSATQSAIDDMDDDKLQFCAIEICKKKSDKVIADTDLIKSHSGMEKNLKMMQSRKLIGVDTRIISITGLTKTQYRTNKEEAVKKMRIMLAESGRFAEYVNDYDVRTEKIGKMPIADWPSDALLNSMVEQIMNIDIDWSDMM